MKKFILSLAGKVIKENIWIERVNNKTYRIIARGDFYNIYLFVVLTLKQYFNVSFDDTTTCNNVWIIKQK